MFVAPYAPCVVQCDADGSQVAVPAARVANSKLLRSLPAAHCPAIPFSQEDVTSWAYFTDGRPKTFRECAATVKVRSEWIQYEAALLISVACLVLHSSISNVDLLQAFWTAEFVLALCRWQTSYRMTQPCILLAGNSVTYCCLQGRSAPLRALQ